VKPEIGDRLWLLLQTAPDLLQHRDLEALVIDDCVRQLAQERVGAARIGQIVLRHGQSAFVVRHHAGDVLEVGAHDRGIDRLPGPEHGDLVRDHRDMAASIVVVILVLACPGEARKGGDNSERDQRFRHVHRHWSQLC